jgi:hypothetical protein|tara:strand:- start:1796 stop:2737 length:942 start_codon:yes stop_codon:yes gene_type:complete
MAIYTDAYETFDSSDRREDLANVIYNISPTDTPFMSSIGTGSAASTLHEWQTDSLAAAATNVVMEGDNLPSRALSATSKLLNYTQISTKPVVVTGTQEVIAKAGMTSEMAYQIAKAGKELKRDMEFDLTGVNVATVGSSGTGRRLRGYEAWCNTNDAHGSGGSTHGTTGAVTDGTQRVLTESLVKTSLKACYDQGGNPDLMLVGSFNKQKVSGFTGNSTRMDMAEDRSLVATIDVYVSDFGEVRVVADRILRSSGRTTHIVDTEMWSTAMLRPFQVQDLAKTGDSEVKQLLVEYTLVSKNEAASAKIADCTTS